MLGVLVSCPALAQQDTPTRLKEVQLGANTFTVADPAPAWIDPSPLPDVNASSPILTRLADTQFLVDQIPVTFVRRATLVNDAASLTAVGRFSINFAPEYERVELHAIHVHRGNELLDRTKTSSVRFLQREQDLEHGIYSGRVTASILIDDLRVGDTLDVSYSTYGQNPVFGGKFTGTASWDQAVPTQMRRVVLNYPADRQISWRMIGDRPAQPVTPKSSLRGGMHKIEFEAHALPETVSEALVPPDFFVFRFLQFSEFASWGDVAKWADALFRSEPPAGDEFQAVVNRLRPLASDELRVAAALEFVQSEIRYFSVSLGENSHRPSPPDTVLQRRYGDCKDKSLLLVALLGKLGIQARPVLLQAGRRAGLEETLPSAAFFDHAIAQVSLGGNTYYLDATRLGQHGRLDRMGQAHEGAQVLVVAPDTGGLSTIATPNIADLVRDELTEQATLSKFGEDGRMETKRVWTGAAAERMRVLLERVSHEQVFRTVGDNLERRYPGAKPIGEPTIHDDPASNILSISAVYSVPKLAVERNGNWIVPFRPQNMAEVVIASPTATRTMPLRIPGYPYQGNYSFEITLPEEVSVVTDPYAETIENRYFRATVSKYFRGNIARTSIDLRTTEPWIRAEDYRKYAEDLEATNKAIVGAFAVNKSSIKTNEGEVDFAHRLRGQRQEAIEKTSETIGTGKLSAADMAVAYCNRSTALSDLGRSDEALRDANEAIRIAPNSVDAIGCRADAYFRAGQFEKSIADYSKAISLGAKSWAYRLRGVAHVYAGRPEDAGADLVTADELADKEGRAYSDIWLVVSYGRLGKPIPEAIAKRAAAESHGEWPRPALAVLTGAMPPQELLKLMDEKKGDDRQMALAEGYFYLGEYYLASGDLKQAQDYFEKTRSLDVIVYTEHAAAKFELQHMQATRGTPSPSPANEATAK